MGIQKLTNFKETKGLFGPKKQAVAELGQKVGEKIEYKGQKLTNFQKKRTFRAKKNKLGFSLRTKKRIFGQKLGKKFRIKAKNLPILKKKNTLFMPKNKLGLSLRKKRIFWVQKKQAGSELKNK